MWKSQTFCVSDWDVFLQFYLKWLSSRIYYYGSSWYNEEFDCSTDAMKTGDTQEQHSTNLSPKKTTVNRWASSTWQTTSHMGGVILGGLLLVPRARVTSFFPADLSGNHARLHVAASNTSSTIRRYVSSDCASTRVPGIAFHRGMIQG